MNVKELQKACAKWLANLPNKDKLEKRLKKNQDELNVLQNQMMQNIHTVKSCIKDQGFFNF